MPLNRADQADAYVVRWTNRKGNVHTVYDANGDKVGRAPSDRSLKNADRVVIYNKDKDEYYTVNNLTDDYDIDEVIAEIEDYYSGD